MAAALAARKFEVIRIPYRVPCMAGGSFRCAHQPLIASEGARPAIPWPNGAATSAMPIKKTMGPGSPGLHKEENIMRKFAAILPAIAMLSGIVFAPAALRRRTKSFPRR